MIWPREKDNEEDMAANTSPKYHVGQMLRNIHSWAKHIPPYRVENVIWDGNWHCYTYGFPGTTIRIAEYMLELVEEAPNDTIEGD